MPSSPTIAHVDMDCFYVSVERLNDPSLNGRPVIVGGAPDSRGVVASASYEARAFGVRSAMPCSQAYRLCPQAIFVTPGRVSYSEYSRRVEAALLEATPVVEMASQDEAYLEMTGTERLWGDRAATAEKLRQIVRDRTGLPCSVGIASNRMIAKIASGMAKPGGIICVPDGGEAAFLRPLEAGVIPGLGPKGQAALRNLGIGTISQIQDLGLEGCQQVLGSGGGDLWRRAMGEGSAVVQPDTTPKSISAETTFERDTADADFLAGILSGLAERVGARLRRADWRARTVGVKFRYAGFETHTTERTLESPTADDLVLCEAARGLLESRRTPGRLLRLVGIEGSNLTREGEGQLSLLVNEDALNRRHRLLAAVDLIRDRHGFDALRAAKSRGQ